MVFGQRAGSDAAPSQEAAPRRRIPFRLILWLVVLGLALWFIFANSNHVHVRLWVHTVTAPMWLVLLCTLIVGMFLGWLGSRRRARRR